MPSLRLSLIASLILAAALPCIVSGETSSSQNAEIQHIIECDQIRVAERFYILENIDQTAKDQRVRRWLIEKIKLELRMMEAQKLDEEQKAFVRRSKARLREQK